MKSETVSPTGATETISPTNFTRTWTWSLSPTTIRNGWDRYRYTMGSNSWWVHIYRAWNVTSAVSTTRQAVNNIFPPTWLTPNAHVTGRTNGNILDTQAGATNFFHGIHFTRTANNSHSQFAKDGVINPTNAAHLQYGICEDNWWRYSPSFCVAPDMSANIHWISHQSGTQRITPAQARQRYIRIIPGIHCLVHNSRPVFDVTSFSWEGVTIADWNNRANRWNHHNEVLGNRNCNILRRRTLLGHVRSNNSFLMVVVEGVNSGAINNFTGMTLRDASRLMFDLGCDYAINLDGGTPSQMFTGNTRRYGEPFSVGSAVCAF